MKYVVMKPVWYIIIIRLILHLGRYYTHSSIIINYIQENMKVQFFDAGRFELTAWRLSYRVSPPYPPCVTTRGRSEQGHGSPPWFNMFQIVDLNPSCVKKCYIYIFMYSIIRLSLMILSICRATYNTCFITLIVCARVIVFNWDVKGWTNFYSAEHDNTRLEFEKVVDYLTYLTK